MKIAVSIVVPVYNAEKTLKRCLESLVHQTLKNIEIICVNDGSTDNSADLLEQYDKKYSNVRIVTQKNGGLSAARNSGMKEAVGEYIGLVDSDDWVSTDFFEKLYNAATKFNADIAAAGIIRLHKFNKKNYLEFKQEYCSDDFEEKLNLCKLPHKSYVWNKIYRSEFLSKNNLKFEEGRIYEDIIFTPQALFYSNKLVTVPGAKYFYWRSSNSLVKRKDAKALEDIKYAHETSKKFLAEHNIDLSSKQITTKRHKILGITCIKIQENDEFKEIRLFNIPVLRHEK